MRKFLLSISAALGCWISGCVTDPTPNYDYDPGLYALDSNIFFRVEWPGDTLLTYGIKSLFLPTNGPILRGSYFVKISSETDFFGNISNNMNLDCNGSLGNQVIEGAPLPRNEFNFSAKGNKPGSREGNYFLTENPRLTDLRFDPPRIHYVDMGSSPQFKINHVDSLYVQGEFNLFLIDPDGITRRPASGSFRLNNL